MLCPISLSMKTRYSNSIAGALWGLIPALLKNRFEVNEVISTLMINYVAAEFLTLLIVGPWRGASQQGFPYTDDLPASATLALIPGSRIHFITLIVAVAVAALFFMLVFYSKYGYELRVIGENRDAARYAGINFRRSTVILMMISGGVDGLAGPAFGHPGRHVGLGHPCLCVGHLECKSGCVRPGPGHAALRRYPGCARCRRIQEGSAASARPGPSWRALHPRGTLSVDYCLIDRFGSSWHFSPLVSYAYN